jgi:hypothetical protein
MSAGGSRMTDARPQSDQARLAEPWQPDQLGGIRPGDYVRLPNVDAPLLVIDLADPLLILQSPSGHQLRAGWQAVTRIRTRDQIEAKK